MTGSGTGRLVERELLTPTLGIFRFELDGGIPSFAPGQYLTLGLVHGDEAVWRPLSIVSPPEETRFVEFLVRWAVHPVAGAFTTRLGELQEGDAIRWKGPKGRFTLRERFPDGSPDERIGLLIAAGTGIAPFVSFVEHVQHCGKDRQLVVLQGASYVDELAYRERFEELVRAGSLSYVPTISRPLESHNSDWSGGSGRVEAWLERPEDGGACALERALSLELDPALVSAYVCGSEAMVHNVRAQLEPLGFRPHADPYPDGRYDLAWEAYG